VLLDGKGPGGADEVEIVCGTISLDGLDEVLESGIKVSVVEVDVMDGRILRDGFGLGRGWREFAGGSVERDRSSGHTLSVRN
jgi:hypothetical protein